MDCWLALKLRRFIFYLSNDVLGRFSSSWVRNSDEHDELHQACSSKYCFLGSSASIRSRGSIKAKRSNNGIAIKAVQWVLNDLTQLNISHAQGQWISILSFD
jgi:hypothetical protein